MRAELQGLGFVAPADALGSTPWQSHGRPSACKSCGPEQFWVSLPKHNTRPKPRALRLSAKTGPPGASARPETILRRTVPDGTQTPEHGRLPQLSSIRA